MNQGNQKTFELSPDLINPVEAVSTESVDEKVNEMFESSYKELGQIFGELKEITTDLENIAHEKFTYHQQNVQQQNEHYMREVKLQENGVESSRKHLVEFICQLQDTIQRFFGAGDNLLPETGGNVNSNSTGHTTLEDPNIDNAEQMEDCASRGGDL